MKRLENAQQTNAGRAPTGVRSIYILEVLATTRTPMTPTEINAILRLPKPTIHRLCQRLESEGFLEKDLDGKRYVPGSRLRNISASVTGFASFAQPRHAVLQRLSEQVGETCNITIPDRAGMLYLDRVETRWPLRIQFPIGDQVPFHCTASGKLYLSSLRKAKRHHLIDALTLARYARNTVVDREQLLAMLDQIRRNGVGTDNEEFVDGMVAIAVPIVDASERLIATLALHAPTQRMSMQDALDHADQLRLSAEKIRATFLCDRVAPREADAWKPR